MSHKKICLECRLSFNRERITNFGTKKICPECGKEMILFPHRFRPPKKNDDEKWKTVEFLVENGFYYQHLYKDRRYMNLDVHENYITYPETLREAKEFVEKYRDQARKKSS
ncbi:hypothetical protein [Desertivirga brevis]|uniref:hypothetical protein n=1 Tax=Desertivirga brevis TaxID=2810310 RepID=UPI001A96EFF2|nr:hypothetical protein [Pedobacter sp. SYSU D00873]